ncbi:hypothetical protein HN695_07770 [Candidatus Woesearchaeota archaeon]|jgi:hypothetical protein|nr:hypothetical protein [Candidatus Woesearchaeota archaeon]MBT5272430.1 hypothetical protein [Candidatus Woesearchaeota archaeon]MBT6041228.1 hypothetical protein [Candidatus Woesearchaeota archaeon]MBT6337484.1 hypothetical protein [Candidatus Woesearchaeota archaeon]MBT7928203.1 hypothetical protein [Candidatus Woesearchaeota archaeon]
MFGLFKSKGITQLRSVFTDYEIINQIYQKLKNLNDSEISSRKAIRDNNIHQTLKEIERQHQIISVAEYLFNVKTLRIGELNKMQREKINNQIKYLENQIKTKRKEHNRHILTIKGDENHKRYLQKHYGESQRKYHEEIQRYKELLNETNKIMNSIRESCKKSIENSHRIIHNI